MKINRRDFVHAGCALAGIVLAPHFLDKAEAGLHFHGSSVFGRSVFGIGNPNDEPFMNFFKGAGSISSATANYPNIFSADGYPTSLPPADITGNLVLPSNYYGRYRLQFTGTGSIAIDGQFIVYSGAGFINAGNVTFSLQAYNQTNPVVEFAFGTLVSGAANNGSGLIRLAVGSTLNVSTGAKYFVQGVGGVSNANSASTPWTITVIDGTHIDLQGSTFAGSYTSGGEAIAQVSQTTFHFPATGTYSGMSGAILCRKADIDGTNAFGLQAGYQINADLVSYVRTVKPKYLRFLDFSGVINATGSDDTKRPLPSAFAYGGSYYVPSYWAGGTGTAGTVARGASDAYTCSNPTASGGGAYADGEQVQGSIDLTNLTVAPTLNVASRGAKPIIQNNGASYLFVGGTFGSGHTINLIFTGSYITGTPYHMVYTTVAGDTSAAALAANLRNAINADATLIAANISAGSNQGTYIELVYNRNAGSGTTFSFTTTGAETITLGTMPISGLPAGLDTFTYNTVLGGWIVTNGLLQSGVSVPVEVLCELCNRTNTNPWFELPLLYSIASVGSMTSTIRTSLNSNLTAAFELANEVWNFGFASTSLARNLGACLGFSFNLGAGGQFESFYGLRVRQFMAQVATSWTGAGGSRASVKCLMAHSFNGGEPSGVGQATQLYRFNGGELTTSNATYAALGGVGGTAGTTYTATGQRPIDFCDAVSYATYFSGAQLGVLSTSWSGLVSYYSTILQASKDYAAGSITTALNAVDTDLRSGTRNGVAGGETIASNLTTSQGWETLYATYDTPRSGIGLAKLEVYCYEGGYEGSPNASFSDVSVPSDLATQFTNNGWDVSAYGASNLIVSTNVSNLFYAYKNSSQFQATVTLAYANLVSAHAGRGALPAWYKNSGSGIWAVMPSDIYTLPYYKSYDAIVEFNA